MAQGATVWLIDADTADGCAEVFRGWLSTSEHQRYRSFTRALRRRQFLAGRGLLRLALAEVLHVPPSDIVLAERIGRAPLLAFPAPGSAGFSLSHSGNWVACAVSLRTAVGLDIERRHRARDVSVVAEHAFGKEQCEALAALPQGERTDVFYRMWTELEARVKLNAACAEIYQFDHPDLSVTLCCAQGLAAAPRLHLARIENYDGKPALTSPTVGGTTGRPVL